MSFPGDIWHVVVRIAATLLLNPPGLPAWATWFLLIIRTVVVVVLFRRNIAPFLLASVSQRIRARSISPRSIRGLYIRSRGRIWRVDRIGWSFHPWAESRLSVKIEGLRLDITDPRLPMRRHRRSLQHLPMRGSMESFAAIVDAAAIMLERISTFNWIYAKASSALIILGRFLVRCIPILTQNIDFDMDSIVISFAALSGVHVIVNGVTLNTKVKFSHLDKDTQTSGDAGAHSPQTSRDKLPSWKIFSSTDRFWERLWGQTQAFASVDVIFNELVISTPPASSIPLSYEPSLSTAEHSQLSYDPYITTSRPLSPETVVHVATPLHFVASLQVTPKSLTVQHHSLNCSLEIPEINVSANGVSSLIDLIKSEKYEDNEMDQLLTPLTGTEPWMPSASFPEAPLPNPTSPSSPFLSAFSHISRHVRSGSVASPAPRVQRIKDPINEAIVSLFRSIQLRVNSITVTHDLVIHSDDHDRVKYAARLSGFRVNMRPSDPRIHALHRKWLGSGERSSLYGATLKLSCEFDLATVERVSSGRMERVARLLSLHGFNVEVLLNNWPQPWIPAPRIFSGNPNNSFVACEITIIKFDLFERLADLCAAMKVMPVPTSNGPRHSLPTVLMRIPQIEFRAHCGDIQVRIACPDGNHTHTTSTIEFQTAGFNIGLSTTYRTMSTTPLRDVDQTSHLDAMRLDSTCHTSIRPIFVSIRQTDSEGFASASPFNAEMYENEPLLGFDAVELFGAGQTLSHLGYGDVAIIQPYTTTLDIKCFTGGISVDLWKTECIQLSRSFLDIVRAWKTHTRNTSHSYQSGSLLPGVSFHLAVGCFTGIFTASDINPKCDLDLSRGIALRTGFSLQYSCVQAFRHSLSSRSPTVLARQQLGLSEDILTQAMASEMVEVGSDDVSALIRGTTWDTICRTTTSTRYVADDSHSMDHTISGQKILPEGVLMSVPRTITQVRLRHRRFNTSTPETKLEETCDISAELPHFMGRLDLLNAYSTLLAMQTLQLFIPRAHAYPQTTRPASNLKTTFHIRAENVHVFCQFPLHERLFVRALSLLFDWTSGRIPKSTCKSIVAWVPSVQYEEKWEELSRIRDLTLNRTFESGVSVTADGVRLVIPHRYVLSELVLNIGLTVKALRHLRRTVECGHYTSMDSPTAESPKHMPKVNLRVHSLTLEAADNPFEAKLGLIWRTGFQAQKVRTERELAFEAKIRAILASGDHEAPGDAASHSGFHYHFTSKRTTSVSDARNRLNMVHSNSWLSAISRQKEEISRKEETILGELRHATQNRLHVPLPIIINHPEKAPPLFRAVVSDLVLLASHPSLPGGYEGFLAEFGNMPRSTEYSLLLPMRLEVSLKATRVNIRDYQLPLLNVPSNVHRPSLEFIANLVIAEEMGSAESVEWFHCPVFRENTGIIGAKAFYVRVPKTIMPVKSYASPEIHFCTPDVIDFTWGVSYNPAVQEVMRVIETLSHPPRDPSPGIGFWDKLRLVFHWRINASFEGAARLHFKGSRDPYHIVGTGAGFDFCLDGNVSIKVGYANEEKELIQLTSDSMIVTIPDHQDVQDGTTIGKLARRRSARAHKKGSSSVWASRHDRKVCAKFSNGIRWGVGVTLERTCGVDCGTCRGDDFSRECRFFTFIPHHQVVLRTADSNPSNNRDSYAGFRSSFIHFSTSLTSPLTPKGNSKHNSFHLTPRTFAHFWSWWHLFDGALSLPIRQGRLFPESRPPSKKFTRHLATLKYRISFSPLYITHVYKIDSGDAWSAGESRCVGVKAFIEHFQADLHQREEETSKVIRHGVGSKIIRHKPFSAVEVVIKGLDLRALFAVFSEPQKKSILLKDSLPGTANFWESLLPTPLSSSWVDADDFVELDWCPNDQEPNLYLLEAASCPRFVYFKRTPNTLSPEEGSHTTQAKRKTKFGDEDSHFCLMGREPTAQEVQLEFGLIRLAELRARLAVSTRVNVNESYEQLRSESSLNSSSMNTNSVTRETSLTQMITLLERYIQHLSQSCSGASGTDERGCGSSDLYDMPTDIELPQVGEFVNVYQVHCPKISLSNATRNILQQYYLASRARLGFEYHMSTRAVKFIRDQAHPIQTMSRETQGSEKRQRTTAAGAQAAAQAFRRILTGEERQQADSTRRPERQKFYSLSNTDPLFGWENGVSERKAHLCLLLKPQIVLRSENSDSNARSVLVLAADHVVLRNHGILDTVNVEDPVSGNIMQRNYADINGLQMFQPVAGSSTDHLPLEVFVDFRCESRDFDRLVPQTHATLRYDKFNRLRLRNNVTTIAVSLQDGDPDLVDHLLHETDLIAIQVPRFSVSANASAFASMNDVVTNLLLFGDPVHKARMTKLETMLFSYNFSDLESAAKVVADLQSRIRQLIRVEGKFSLDSIDLDDASQHELLASKAHVLTLSQELNLIFDAIKLSQDKADDRNQEKKSALRLQASSSEISWQMIDDNRELLAKLAVQGIDYSWLSRQDSSSANKVDICDLQVFDGSPAALWPEILSKHDDPPTHHMIRRGLFAEIQWSVLAPVGGISIYDRFEVELHPIRLAFETQLGNKLLDYFIPGRRSRREAAYLETTSTQETPGEKSIIEDPVHVATQLTVRPPSTLPTSGPGTHQSSKKRPIPSRSFSNIRSAAADSHVVEYHIPGLPKSRSSTALVDRQQTLESSNIRKNTQSGDASSRPEGDASEMRQRSTQKTFVHVKIPSVHVHLSVMKGRNLLVRDARLRTHDLEWRNRTWSFDELISQFIPSDPSWRGWVKVAWQQHVFSVGGVVKELITKTQWGRMGKNSQDESSQSSRDASRRAIGDSPEDHLHPPARASQELFDASTPGDSAHGRNAGLEPDMAPRPRTISKTRASNLFRRQDSKKNSVDSTETSQLPTRRPSDF